MFSKWGFSSIIWQCPFLKSKSIEWRKIRIHAKLKLQMRIFLMQQQDFQHLRNLWNSLKSSHFWPLNLFFTVHFSKENVFDLKITVKYQIKVHFRQCFQGLRKIGKMAFRIIITDFAMIFFNIIPIFLNYSFEYWCCTFMRV